MTGNATRRISYLNAINEAQTEEMRRDPRVFLMGEDVQTPLFGADGLAFVAEFGKERVRNTPISEAAIVGAAAGAAMTGMRPIVDLTIASFVFVAMDQLVSIVAKAQYLYGGQTRLPVVIRTCMYYNSSLAAQHSDRPYSMLMNVPGLVVVAPSNAADVKGLLKASIASDDPVIFVEDSTLWGSREQVPASDDYYLPLGVSEVKREGRDVTVVAIAGAVPLALAAAAELQREGIEVEVVDPRTLSPLDREPILESVRKTGRLIAVDPSCRTCGASAEILASVGEELWRELRAPMRRVTTPDVHVPFSPALEKNLYPTKDAICAAVQEVVKA